MTVGDQVPPTRLDAVEAPQSLRLALVTLVVDDYDDAIRFFVDVLGFSLDEDSDLGDGKRWVVVRPDANGAGILLAKADDPDQLRSVGRQSGGRVSFFLHTDDLDRQFALWSGRGVRFAEEPRTESYGKVVVFLDLYGNKWDLIEPARDR